MPKSQTQTFLAFIMVGILCIGFIGVWYVDAYYNDNESITLYETDSNVEFSDYEFETPVWHNITPSQIITGSLNLHFDRTPVYTGNNTWVMATNDTVHNYNSAYYYINMPNLDDWVIDKIFINMTENDDSSYYTKMSLTSFDLVSSNVLEDGSGISYDIPASVDYDTGTGGWFNRTLDLTLTDSLVIFNNAQGKDVNFMTIMVFDDGADWNGFPWQIQMKIVGQQVDSWSMVDITSMVIGVSVGLNIIAMIYLTDEIDIGGYTKDIRKRRK